MDSRPGGSGPEGSRHGRRARRLLSFLFLLHFGAILVFLAPRTDESVQEYLPGWLHPVAAPVPPVVEAATPVSNAYLRLVGGWQSWYMFAPEPVSWSSSLRVLAYYPRAQEEPRAVGTGEADAEQGGVGPPRPSFEGSARGDASADSAPGWTDSWRADTVLLEGPREVPFPHWVGHRPYRLWHNVGQRGWGDSYRVHLADYLCRKLRNDADRRPDGIALEAIWERTRVPWRRAAPYELETQALGGFDCPGGEQ